jgi:hypothetical protein
MTLRAVPALLAIFLGACTNLTFAPEPAMRTLLATSTAGSDSRYLDSRYCGPPARDPVTKAILRDPKVTAAYRRIHACPATNLFSGACPLWALDHVLPLDSGGCDSVSNMQWLPVWLKSCAGGCKDRWERKINCRPVSEGGTGCTNEIVLSP